MGCSGRWSERKAAGREYKSQIFGEAIKTLRGDWNGGLVEGWGGLGFEVELIALAADCDEVLGVCGIGFEFGAEGGDEVVDGAGAGVGVVAPDGVEEAFAGDGFSGVGGEEAEDAEFFFG
jgi:hypothetical protein